MIPNPLQPVAINLSIFRDAYTRGRQGKKSESNFPHRIELQYGKSLIHTEVTRFSVHISVHRCAFVVFPLRVRAPRMTEGEEGAPLAEDERVRVGEARVQPVDIDAARGETLGRRQRRNFRRSRNSFDRSRAIHDRTGLTQAVWII